MFERTLASKLKELFLKFPVLTLMGPRQSGKTTLVRRIFSELPYLSMEDFSERQFAEEDPKGFLASYQKGLIIDEAQHVPKLFSYVQMEVDKRDQPGLYVLTGSQQFLVNSKIAQTLAGRTALATLLPLSYFEMDEKENDLWALLYKGFYPRLYRYDISPLDFYPSYIQTYVERDVRQIQNISDLTLFQKFLKLCAGRVGQLLNVSSLANDCGISSLTAKSWISLLEASYILYLLRPHHINYNKRLVKSPKLYFYDTGVLCSLLDITEASQLEYHYAKGSIFENFILTESLKFFYNQGQRPNSYFWRDKLGHEIDLLLEKGNNLTAIEIKSGQTISNHFFENIRYWKNLSEQEKAFVIYAGEDQQARSLASVLNWREMQRAF